MKWNAYEMFIGMNEFKGTIYATFLFFVQKPQMVVVFGNKANNYLLLSEERKKRRH